MMTKRRSCVFRPEALPVAAAMLAMLLRVGAPAAPTEAPPWIEAAPGGGGFVLAPSGKAFVPWGFNYDRDYRFRLIEEYWEAEWTTVERDFREMRELGANVVRVHLQFGKFMDAPDKPNTANLERLERLVRLAEQTGLYLDLTGLGSYRKQDVPAWYNALAEGERWAAQAAFWEAIARTCAERPGVFCYDLMNEPVVSAGPRAAGEWVHPAELGGFYYVQYINLDPAGRQRPAIAAEWTRRMAQAIRRHDKRRLITIGLILIELGKPEEASGFAPSAIAPELGFLCVHVYPESGKIEAALDLLKRCDVGKPLVIEETFPLRCDRKTLEEFIKRSRDVADGWIGFYWGQTPAELKGSSQIGEQITLAWLELFQAMNPNR